MCYVKDKLTYSIKAPIYTDINSVHFSLNQWLAENNLEPINLWPTLTNSIPLFPVCGHPFLFEYRFGLSAMPMPLPFLASPTRCRRRNPFSSSATSSSSPSSSPPSPSPFLFLLLSPSTSFFPSLPQNLSFLASAKI